ncbi:piggyBac transposable element-derived protein 3-like [Bacillus rossius redtenbacheri]|uniref:piggyBac transposable element-derived protein 3-like n=1 Tax=Bacillus rossius redtenbacheri TaxID=93214 RepID=UPI002FDEC0D5
MKQRKKTGVIFPSESESSLGLSDDSNADPTFRLTSCESSASTECSDSEQYSEETVSTSGPSTPKGNITGSLQPTKKQVSFPRKLVWKIGNLDVPAWYADTVPVPVGDFFMNLDTPFQFFNYFFGDEIFEKILSESQHYAIQKDPNKPLAINKNELKKFVGICIIMSVVHLPNTRSYWNASLGNTIIQETMSCNRFENIRTNLHFSNNEDTVPSGQPGHDRLHKIRPVINHLNAKFASVPMEESLSLDEQLCATKARHYLKQYMPMKPHKWGYKLFILSGVSGFAYKFEVYSGMENDESQRLESEPDLGACANVVVRLGRLIPEKKNHRLYFDNYFTTPGLMVFFEKKGIHCLGTVRQNRLPGVKVPSKKELLKKERGYSSECVTRVEDVDLSCVVWKDNKAVTLMSTFAGENPKCKVSRFDKKKKEIIEVECPNVVSIYNKHMGGVDLLDSIIGRYKIKLRSKKMVHEAVLSFLRFDSCKQLVAIQKSTSREGNRQ